MMLTERFPEFAPHLDGFVAVCHRLYEQGFVCAWDGNVSLRVGEHILVTPTHLCKGDVRVEDLIVVMEAAESLGAVPLVPFIDHGTQALADAVGRAMRPEVRACVMERHGAVTCGRSLEEAYFLTESLERLAKTETILATVNF